MNPTNTLQATRALQSGDIRLFDWYVATCLLPALFSDDPAEVRRAESVLRALARV
jgi:hypothetical protein